jgi:hypothetical protein
MAADINALNQEISDLRKQLGERPLTPFDSKDLDKALLTVKALRQEFRESAGDLDYISKSFKDSVNELSRQNTYLTSARKSINGISDISKQIVDFRRGENTLSEKQLLSLKNQSRVKFEELKLSIKSGQLNASQLSAAQAALDEKDAFNESLNRTIELQNQVNKEVGLLGNGLEGAGKFLQKLGFANISKPISDAIQKTKDARFQIKLNEDELAKLREEYGKIGTHDLERKKQLRDQMASLKEQNKELDKQTSKYKNIAGALKEQFTLTNMTDAVMGKVVQSFFALNEAQTKFQNLTGGTVPILDQMNGRFITSVDYIKTAAALTEQTGMNASAIFSPDTLAASAEMVKMMGMTQEQANKAALWSQASGKSVDQMNASIKKGTAQHNSTNRSALAYGQIMREVYSTSTAVAASMGNSTSRITEAVTRAKDLGLSLQEVDNIAGSLLDVEQSIAKEFEYEVISGKQINLEAARYYALTNQTEKLTKEIGKNQAIVQSFASGNRIEQEAAAAALGMNRDQLAEMYMAQQRQAGLTDAQIAKNMNMAEGDIKRLTAQESINTAISKMTELLAGPAEFLSSILSTAWALYPIMAGIGTIMTLQLVKGAADLAIGLGAAIPKLAVMLGLESGIAAAKISGAMAATLGLGAIAIIGGIAAGVMAMKSNTASAQNVNDGTAPASKGPFTVTDRFGATAITAPGDHIAVSPNLIKSSSQSTPSIRTPQQSTVVQQSSPAIDYDKMAQALSKVNVNTNIDGVKVSNELFNKPSAAMAVRKI